jgi:hypothetical protein
MVVPFNRCPGRHISCPGNLPDVGESACGMTRASRGGVVGVGSTTKELEQGPGRRLLAGEAIGCQLVYGVNVNLAFAKINRKMNISRQEGPAG